MQKPRISEKEFQAQVVALARRCGFRVYHTYNSRRSAAGFPDLVLVHAGRGEIVYAELKVPPNKLTPEQAAWIEALRAAGQRAFVWTPDDWTTIEETLIGRRTA
jgi:hypothetical protein